MPTASADALPSQAGSVKAALVVLSCRSDASVALVDLFPVSVKDSGNEARWMALANALKVGQICQTHIDARSGRCITATLPCSSSPSTGLP